MSDSESSDSDASEGIESSDDNEETEPSIQEKETGFLNEEIGKPLTDLKTPDDILNNKNEKVDTSKVFYLPTNAIKRHGLNTLCSNCSLERCVDDSTQKLLVQAEVIVKTQTDNVCHDASTFSTNLKKRPANTNSEIYVLKYGDNGQIVIPPSINPKLYMAIDQGGDLLLKFIGSSRTTELKWASFNVLLVYCMTESPDARDLARLYMNAIGICGTLLFPLNPVEEFTASAERARVLVETLAKQKINLDYYSNTSHTLLTFCALRGFTEAVCALLDHGADINLVRGNTLAPKTTISECSSRHGKFYANCHSSPEALRLYKIIVILLQRSAKIELEGDEFLKMSMNAAIFFKDIKLVKLFLPFFSKTDDVIHYALLFENEPVMSLVKKRNFNFEFKISESIFLAVVLNYDKLSSTHLHFLMQYAADPNYLCSTSKHYQETALSVAAAAGKIDIVRTLLILKADVNKSTNSTPLMQACKNGHKEVVDLLLRYDGIDVKKVNQLGQSAAMICIMLCEESKQVEILQSLSAKNPEIILCMDIFGYTMLHHAVRANSASVITWLSSVQFPYVDHKAGALQDGETALDMTITTLNMALRPLVLSFYRRTF
jgi:ankyrin repeat protein